MDFRKTSHSSELSRSDSEGFLSGGGVPVGTSTREKILLDTSGKSGDAGILRKSSICQVKNNVIIQNSFFGLNNFCFAGA